MKIKQDDRELITFFRENARQTLTKISRTTGIPVSTIFDKLRKYEGDVIKRHTTLLNMERLGYNTRAHILIKTIPENRQALATYLSTHKNVNNIFRINNEYDFIIEAAFSSVQELEQFTEQLELENRVTKKQLHFIIEEISREQMYRQNLL